MNNHTKSGEIALRFVRVLFIVVSLLMTFFMAEIAHVGSLTGAVIFGAISATWIFGLYALMTRTELPCQWLIYLVTGIVILFLMIFVGEWILRAIN